jgi:hypothetical protein
MSAFDPKRTLRLREREPKCYRPQSDTPEGRARMQPRYAVTLLILVGVIIGGAAVQTLHAQMKPPAYLIALNEVTNQEAYLREFSIPSRAHQPRT